MKNGKLNYKFKNFNLKINNVCTPYDEKILDNSLIYSKKVSKDIVEKLATVKNCVLIFPEHLNDTSYNFHTSNIVILAQSPRLEYAKLMLQIEEYYKKNSNLDYVNIANSPYSVCGKNSYIGNETIIEPYVFIENGVNIGKNCLIQSGVRISGNVQVGNNVVIKSNSVIGGSGFGVEVDEFGRTYKIPHIGGVVIEDNVEVGALSTVCSGTIHPTIVREYTKIDDHVHIGHNANIGRSCIITACCEIPRSKIEDNVWIGPNSSLIQGIKIGKNAYIGVGSVVTKDVPSDTVVAGSPAQNIERLKKIRKKLRSLLDE